MDIGTILLLFGAVGSLDRVRGFSRDRWYLATVHRRPCNFWGNNDYLLLVYCWKFWPSVKINKHLLMNKSKTTVLAMMGNAVFYRNVLVMADYSSWSCKTRRMVRYDLLYYAVTGISTAGLEGPSNIDFNHGQSLLRLDWGAIFSSALGKVSAIWIQEIVWGVCVVCSNFYTKFRRLPRRSCEATGQIQNTKSRDNR